MHQSCHVQLKFLVLKFFKQLHDHGPCNIFIIVHYQGALRYVFIIYCLPVCTIYFVLQRFFSFSFFVIYFYFRFCGHSFARSSAGRRRRHKYENLFIKFVSWFEGTYYTSAAHDK